MNKLKVLSACAYALLLIMGLSGCGSTALLRHQEGLSRDDYYLDFSHHARVYVDQNVIGGEHQTFYHVLGFTDDKLQIRLTPSQGIAHFGLQGDGFTVQACEREEPLTIQLCEVNITADHTWVTIAVYAYPVDGYKLEIKPLKIIKNEK